MQLCDIFYLTGKKKKKGKSTASPPVHCASGEMYNLKQEECLSRAGTRHLQGCKGPF